MIISSLKSYMYILQHSLLFPERHIVSLLSNGRRMVFRKQKDAHLFHKGIAVLSSRLYLSRVLHDCLPKKECLNPVSNSGRMVASSSRKNGMSTSFARHCSTIKQIESVLYYPLLLSGEWSRPFQMGGDWPPLLQERRGMSTSSPKKLQSHQAD